MRHECAVSKHIVSMSHGPSKSVICYKVYIINEFSSTQENEKKGKRLKIVELL